MPPNSQLFNGTIIDPIFTPKALSIKLRTNMKVLWLPNSTSEAQWVKSVKDLRPERIWTWLCSTTIICGWSIIFSILNKLRHFIILETPMNFLKWRWPNYSHLLKFIPPLNKKSVTLPHKISLKTARWPDLLLNLLGVLDTAHLLFIPTIPSVLLSPLLENTVKVHENEIITKSTNQNNLFKIVSP